MAKRIDAIFNGKKRAADEYREIKRTQISMMKAKKKRKKEIDRVVKTLSENISLGSHKKN